MDDREEPGSEEAGGQLNRLRRICASLPHTWEKLSHGTPTFFVGKRVFAMFDNNHHRAGHLGLWIAAQMADQEMLVATNPRRYYRPPYVGYKGWIGIELGEIDDDLLAFHLREAWQLIAAKSTPKSVAKRP